MVKVRELTIQQINAALAEIQKAINEILRHIENLEEESKKINAFVTLIIQNTENEDLKKQMIKVLKGDEKVIEELIKKEEELIQ